MCLMRYVPFPHLDVWFWGVVLSVGYRRRAHRSTNNKKEKDMSNHIITSITISLFHLIRRPSFIPPLPFRFPFLRFPLRGGSRLDSF